MIQSESQSSISRSDFQSLRDLIYRESGISLDQSKQTFLQSRLQKRLRALRIESFSEYFDYLQMRDPDGRELQQMINRVTTNKTHFFREEHHFEYLRDVVFRSLIESADRGERPKQLRIWSAACSSGEEPYSLAIAVDECFAKLPGWDIRILASDIDTNVLEQASEGIFHCESVEDLDVQRRNRNFLKGTNKQADFVSVHPRLKELITFKQINFSDAQWPVHAKFDAIFCRNVLIYFDEETQDRLVRRFEPYLHPDGFLFIGHSESLGRTKDVYERVGPTVFQRTELTRENRSPRQRRSGVQREGKDLKGKSSPISKTPGLKNHATQDLNVGPRVGAFDCPNIHRIIVGDVFSSETQAVVSTTLGSCIATCLYDEVSRVGGMNHFALPVGISDARAETSFGINAMELLINQLLQLGAAKERLKAKVFGGANLSEKAGSQPIGSKNEEFVRRFLETENIPIAAELLGGNLGMCLHFETSSGRVRLKFLAEDSVLDTNAELAGIKLPEPDVTIF